MWEATGDRRVQNTYTREHVGGHIAPIRRPPHSSGVFIRRYQLHFIVLCTIKNGFATAIKAHRQIRYDKGENDELCNELGRSLGDQPCLYT